MQGTEKSRRRSPEWLLCVLLLTVDAYAAVSQDLPRHLVEASEAIGKPIFRGVVRDSGGRPIAGAEIRLGSDFHLHGAEDSVRGLVLATDAEGRFQDFSPAGPEHAFMLVVTAPGYARHFREAVQVGDEPFDIVLATAARVVGRIVDREGRPVAGARWWLAPDLGKIREALGPAPLDRGVTDGDGSFRAEARPGGTAWVRAESDGWRGESERFALELPEVELAVVRLDREVEARHPASAPPASAVALGGRVLDADGQPLAGATVRVSAGPVEGGASPRTTDAEGRWRLELPGNRKYYLTFEHEEHVETGRRLSLKAGSEASAEELVVRMEPAGVVWGEIHGLELRHFSNFRVAAVTADRVVATGAEIDRGPPATFRLEGVPLAGARLRAQLHSQAIDRDFGELAFSGAGDVLRRDLVIAPAPDLTARLTVDGAVLPDFSWSVDCPGRGRTGGLVQPIEGTFVIYDLEPGGCSLRLDGFWPGDGRDRLGHRRELWTAGEGDEIEVALHSATLAGRLVDRRGAPVAGAEVTLAPADGPDERLDEASTDDQGRFDFGRVIEGRWRVWAAEPGGESLGSWRIDAEGDVEVELAP